jgi:diguanylate cyclase (GGDEF)-like protein/PAS domain S-box-containing protein
MSLSRFRPGSGVHRQRLTARSLAGVLLAVVVFGSSASATLYFKHLSERGLQTQLELQAVITELHTQDALEWRVISGRVRARDVADDLARSRANARRLIAQVGAHSLVTEVEHSPQVFTAQQDRYARGVDWELRLLDDGAAQDAEEFDEAEVAPVFEAAVEALQAHTEHTAAASLRAQTLSDGGVGLAVLLSLVVTALVQSRRRRDDVRRWAERRSEARYRALVDQSSDLVVVAERDGAVSYLSPSAARLLPPGAGTESLLLTELVLPQDRRALSATLSEVRDGRSSALEVRVPTTAGVRTLEVWVQDLTGDPAVAGLVLTGHDVTDREALNRELEHRALHDSLTGLPNRALLADRFDQALGAETRGGAATGLLLIDLDRFKEINDTLGHHYGDELLLQIGPRLAEVLRAGDTVGRLGGDEFAVLLPEVGTLAAAVAVAAKLQSALVRSFTVDGIDLDIEASIGVVVSGEHGADRAALMQRADIAMYTAKQRSLGVSVYDPDTDGHSPLRLALLGDLRRALAGDELFLHYQPTVSLSTGQVCGAEALLRWQHPERGLIPPDAFIPLAENTGLIGPLTTYVLDLALGQARRWADAGQPLQVAVNLSARNLLDDRLETTVADLLDRHGVGADLLKLEVTESAIMTDPVRAKTVLERLEGLGVALSIDDFGAGYTSLSQLKHLPVTELKIDRSFVTTMSTDASNTMIVRSVIELGHNLGLTTVAEGVETDEALDDLAGYSCDVAQGYHLSRPLTAEAFDAWRAAWPGLSPLTTFTALREAG